MSNLLNVFKFGWPFMRQYWTRLATALMLSVLFGLSNASFVWVTKTLFERMATDHQATSAVASAKPAETAPAVVAPPATDVRHYLKAINRYLLRWLDPWLPLMGRAIDWKQIVGGLLILPIMVAFSRYLGYLATYCTNWVSERVIADLRVAMLRKLNSLSLDYFNRSTMGDLTTRVNSDTAAVQRCMSLGFNDLIKEPITVISVFSALFFVDAKLTLLAIVFLPLCTLPLIYLGRKVRKAAKSVVSAVVSQASLLLEVLSGIRVVKAFGLEAEQELRYREYARQTVHHGMKGVQARELVNPLMETIAMFGLGLLITVIFYTRTSLPDLVGFLTGVIVMFTPIKKLANVGILFQQTSVGVDRLLQVMNEQPSVKEPVPPKSLNKFQTALNFDKVSFSYGQKPVLQDLSLVIPRGHKLGIAGESGCGKSTLVNLVFRFYDPTAGRVLLDGVDIREFSSHALRLQMALVSQEIVIFDQTVAQNIACGRTGATRAEVEFAAHQAYAHEFIMQLPQGYDSRVGERGVTLSVGQRQRLCIARAFVRNAPILVLDEATASLDSQAESEVQAAIDRLEENRTVICIAHRLSTLTTMDNIIVLGQGRILEAGTFDELLRRRGVFANMAQKQGIQIPT
ncbi:MAG: ABC transporter ATP-binding protein [Verrucomicrobiota bacterium]